VAAHSPVSGQLFRLTRVLLRRTQMELASDPGLAEAGLREDRRRNAVHLTAEGKHVKARALAPRPGHRHRLTRWGDDPRSAYCFPP
jgi:hypothetical protein